MWTNFTILALVTLQRLVELYIARRNTKRLLANGEDPAAVVELLSRALTNKLMHAPSHALNHVHGEDRQHMEALLWRLFNVHPE